MSVKKMVQVVHPTKEEQSEIDRYLAWLKDRGESKGRAYAQAMVEKMDRDRAAGRFV